VNLGDFMTKLAARLFERRGEAIPVSRALIESGDWRPKPNDCHRNATMLCSLTPVYTAVRGWFAADYLDLGFYKFFAHSVVEDAGGNLFDITPNQLPWNYPFLKHDPTDGDFLEMIESQQITSVIHRL
jgi:hypothetical protein